MSSSTYPLAGQVSGLAPDPWVVVIGAGQAGPLCAMT